MELTRRDALKAGLIAGTSLFVPPTRLLAQTQPLIQKKIPSSGELLPIIGIGTARRYEDVKNDAEKKPLRETIQRFKELGGKVIDSSPSYGTAEAVVGELVDGLKVRDSLFLATKVSLREEGKEAGLKQIERSFKRLRTKMIDLLAVHNLRDTDTQLATLRELKAAGRIRYVGITPVLTVSTATSNKPSRKKSSISSRSIMLWTIVMPASASFRLLWTTALPS